MNNKYTRLAAVIMPVLLAAICLVQVVKNNNQAIMSVPREYVLLGEYSYDGENWYPYNEDSDISALEGELVVKGHLDSDVTEGAILNLFCNHIGLSIYINGEMVYIDAPSELKGYRMELISSMCGKRWEQLLFPQITTEDEVEFHFTNYHKHGNKNAYKEALSSLLVTPLDNSILEVYLKSYIEPFERAGYALLIVAVMLLGASLSAVVFKSNIANRLFKIGASTLFAGGYMLFDRMMISFKDELLAVKTYGGQLCLMLAIYFIGLMLCDSLKDKYKKAAEIVMSGSAIVNLLIILLVVTGNVLLYDTLFFWEWMQCIISIALMVLCILELKKEKKCRMELILYTYINMSVLMDMAGVGYHKYYSGICFKIGSVIMLLLFMFIGVEQIIINQQAALKNKKLKEELEQSRISVMLSQIQPHFLYNSLTSVMDLCDSNPKAAKAAIADFADYLRGNLASLKTENLICFETELAHIQKYLKLEKLRFQDELEVVYDIQSKDFMLPALSVQPLVENAVKHGVGQKIGGGTVTIHTFETEDDYVIQITDDGVGFEEGQYADNGGTHVGVENTKKRLEMMADARLEIESKKNEGTTATILIPKRGD